MSARRPTFILLALLLVSTACARLFPATDPNEPRVRSARPHVEKDVSRRRGGSDVTLPSEPETKWPAAMLPPCNRADSVAARQPGGDCQLIDRRADSLRAPADTATKSRP